MKPYPIVRGPSLLLLGIVHILLLVASLVAAAALRHGTPYVNPFAPAEAVRIFFQQNPTAVRVSSFLLFASAIPLGIFTMTMVNRLRVMGIRAAGVNIALFGGLTAAQALLFSGLTGWILSLPEVATSAAVVQAIYFVSFLTGGAMYAAGFGLLAAGVSLTSHFFRLLPRWLFVLGMVIAVAGELSTFSLITYPANFLIPITRYVGFVWLLLAAIRLTRHDSGERGLQATA